MKIPKTLTMITLCLIALLVLVIKEHLKDGPATASAAAVTEDHSFDDLLDTIEQEESGGDANAVCPNGCCVGAYQLTKIYVDEVNRISSARKYTYADRWDKNKSRVMSEIYLEYWGGRAISSYMLENWADPDLWEVLNEYQFEIIARIHNGGPNGWKKKSTKPYWQKIKARLEKE